MPGLSELWSIDFQPVRMQRLTRRKEASCQIWSPAVVDEVQVALLIETIDFIPENGKSEV